MYAIRSYYAIRSFWEEADGLSFEKFLKTSFQTIREKQVENLIIDLRNNEGGIDKRGALLMSYLTNKEFGVITSYSIHYTKLYDTDVRRRKC